MFVMFWSSATSLTWFVNWLHIFCFRSCCSSVMHPTVWGQSFLLFRRGRMSAQERDDWKEKRREEQMLPQEEGWAAHLLLLATHTFNSNSIWTLKKDHRTGHTQENTNKEKVKVGGENMEIDKNVSKKKKQLKNERERERCASWTACFK